MPRTPLAGQHAVNLRSLVARVHKSHNDRDLDALSKVFDEDVEIVVDGGALPPVARLAHGWRRRRRAPEFGA